MPDPFFIRLLLQFFVFYYVSLTMPGMMVRPAENDSCESGNVSVSGR